MKSYAAGAYKSIMEIAVTAQASAEAVRAIESGAEHGGAIGASGMRRLCTLFGVCRFGTLHFV